MPFVEIYNRHTQEIEECMGPHEQSSAERIMRGASINLDHANYAVRIVDEPTATEKSI